MRAIVGVLSLLIVLAVVGSLAKKQLQALGRRSVGASAAVASQPASAGDIRATVRDETVRALQQGADRTRKADDGN